MPDPVTATVGAAVVGGGASYLGGKAQAKAASSAASAQERSAAQSMELQRDMFEKQVKLNEPWQKAGLRALDLYAKSPDFKFTYNQFTADPGYKFRQQQGVNALDMSAAARGKVLSGAQDKAIAGYGQQLASEEYGNAYQRALQNYNTRMNENLNIANIGRGAAGQTQNAMQNFATGGSNAMLQAGQAAAQGALGAGQAQAGMMSNLAQTANQGMSNYLLYNMMNKPVTPLPSLGISGPYTPTS